MCEMEKTRAGQCRLQGQDLTSDGCNYQPEVIHGDAFALTWDGDDPGASVLFLNPEYTQDPEFKRIEERFLFRFTQALAPGGALIYVVPHRSLPASAATLAKFYKEHRCWRFPDPSFQDFGQVVLVARRRSIDCPEVARPEAEELIRTWSDPAHLWPLPETCKDPLRLERARNGRTYGLQLTLLQADLRRTVAGWRLMSGLPTGAELDVDELIGRQYWTAMPPRPAHLALAVASGIFNGRQLEPNDRFGYPPLLLKGRFVRDSVELEAKQDKKGRQTGSVRLEQPRLELRALRLDTYEFFEPRPGVAPTGEQDLEKMNTADLLGHYSTGLADLMAAQFPPIHHPGRPEEQIQLPPVARQPFECQVVAIQTALKTLGHTGENPFLVAEVGTGKSQVFCQVMEALRPENHAATCAELDRVSRLRVRPPVVRRGLVMCPPHLVGSWIDQAAAVVPDWTVIEVTGIADLEREADLYILSREKAKLGAAVEGVCGGCPRCGAPAPAAPAALASRRMRCEARRLRPANGYAIDLDRLAVAVRSEVPRDEVVRAVCARYCRLNPEGGAVDHPRVCGVLDGLLERCEGLAEFDGYSERDAVLSAVGGLARWLGRASETGQALKELGAKGGSRWERSSGYQALYALGAVLSGNEEALRRRLGENEDQGAGQAKDLEISLESLYRLASWHQEEPCGETLYSATLPRRVPLATQIVRRYRDRFDLFCLDEAHEFNSAGSAQAKAAHRLLGLGKPALLLSGSIMGGYASSLFANMYAANRCFRESFGRGDVSGFIDKYGYRKTLYTPAKGERAAEIDYGKQSDREQRCCARRLGEAPGVLPTFLMDHLLPVAATMHKADLEKQLPEMDENQVPLTAETAIDEQILSEYHRLQRELLTQIKADMFSPLTGKLLGQLLELPSYLDRCTDDQSDGPFRLAYPESCGGKVVAEGRRFPASIRTPKERWLLGRLREALAAEDRVMIFLRHTGGTSLLPARLLRILREEIDPSAQWLDVRKVSARKREDWITKNVNRPGCRVLLVNPRAVQTGLNALVTFNRTIWYETEWSPYVFRQANGRVHRIGTVRHVTVDWPYYSGTAQEKALELVAPKVSASLQVDGLSIVGALEACGLDPESQAAAASTMSIGHALYNALMRDAA